MVPNAIIRSSQLSVSEKAVWCYIASMPNGYRYTVRSACDILHINEKTWCRCVCKLERKGLISVKNVPGQTNVYEAVRNMPEWVETPTKIVGGSNGTPTKIAVPPPPNEYPTTHYNKKKQLNNNVDDDTRKKLEQEVMIDLNIELACKSCGITAEEYRQLAEKIIAEGEAEYMKILSGIYNTTERAELYTFVRALDAAKKSMKGEKTLILSADSPLAEIFNKVE